MDYFEYKYIYYGLTKDEAQQFKLIYRSRKYNIKGVNVSLKGLKRFILDNKMANLIYQYTKLPINTFKIRKDVIYDKKYDMIGVGIPFRFKIQDVKYLF